MFIEIKEVEKNKIREYIIKFSQIEYLENKINELQSQSNYPVKKFNFFEKHITKRKEYKQEMKRIEEKKELNRGESESAKIEIEALRKEIQKEMMRRFGSFSLDIKAFYEELKRIENATTFQELGYSSEEEVRETLEKNGIPIQFHSIEEGLRIFPETARTNVEFMRNAVNTNFANIRYDKTNDENVYKIYLNRKIDELQRQQINDRNIDTSEEIRILKEYVKELDEPRMVENGKYKVPHRYMFEELRRLEQTDERENSGNAYTGTYKYMEVDGKFSAEFGQQLEAMYSREDIVFGLHGTSNRDVSGYLQSGLRESKNHDRPRQANNTVLYGEYLTFTNALDYGGMWSNSVVILGLPQNAFSEKNPSYIWGSDEKNGDKYILPEYVMGYYTLGDKENRTVVENSEKIKKQYRYLHRDATVDPYNSKCLDTEDTQRI